MATERSLQHRKRYICVHACRAEHASGAHKLLDVGLKQDRAMLANKLCVKRNNLKFSSRDLAVGSRSMEHDHLPKDHDRAYTLRVTWLVQCICCQRVSCAFCMAYVCTFEWLAACSKQVT